MDNRDNLVIYHPRFYQRTRSADRPVRRKLRSNQAGGHAKAGPCLGPNGGLTWGPCWIFGDFMSIVSYVIQCPRCIQMFFFVVQPISWCLWTFNFKLDICRWVLNPVMFHGDGAGSTSFFVPFNTAWCNRWPGPFLMCFRLAGIRDFHGTVGQQQMLLFDVLCCIVFYMFLV